MVAVATNALAFAADPIPEFETSAEAVLHMDDAPEQISAEGSPNTVAAAAQSLFQTDCVALSMVLGTSWALRAPASSSVAVVESVTW